MAETHGFDVVIVGAGIAGATTAAALAGTHRVALIEAEETPGYHSTGRSAAIFIQNYGPPDVRQLARLSRPFFEHPPEGFADGPIIRYRPVAFLAPPDQGAVLDEMLRIGIGMVEVPVSNVAARVPALRPDYATRAGWEADAFDLDVAAIHQGFLRQLRAREGVLALRARSGRIERRAGRWDVTVTDGSVFRAPVIVNAAGAWGDEVALQAGVTPLGLVPCRRTAAIIDASPHEPEDWPLVQDAAHTWYARAEARTKLMVTPADETPTTPHDVQPDELDVAIGIDRMQQALAIEVRRVEHRWAGLRTFTPDRSLAFGPDPRAEGFFWCVGQGGYGIQTSPSAGRLMAGIVAGIDAGMEPNVLDAMSPARFSSPASSQN